MKEYEIKEPSVLDFLEVKALPLEEGKKDAEKLPVVNK